jgi:hypothetical protein
MAKRVFLLWRENSEHLPVWSVTGSSGSLTRGMRVDALFFRKGSDGNPLIKHQLLLILRNVEVDGISLIKAAAIQRSPACC